MTTEAGSAPVRRHVDVNGIRIGLLEYGQRGGSAVVLLHGIRDLAWGLHDVAAGLARSYTVYSIDLRGHGDSDHTPAYSIPWLMADLMAVLDELGLERAHLVGHSLGGRTACMCAAAFPARVLSLSILDGLGPPPQAEMPLGEDFRRRVERLRALRHIPRALPDLEFAAERLMRAHPRLEPTKARWLADKGTWLDAREQLLWRWDPRVESIWLTTTREEYEASWPEVACPVLLVDGELAGEYWGRAGSRAGRTRHDIDAAEHARRIASFRAPKSIVLEGIGHMVHYDDPARVTQEIGQFLSALDAPPHALQPHDPAS